jgi:aromatic-L-amino-acid/L-tryptophan decarboxylase
LPSGPPANDRRRDVGEHSSSETFDGALTGRAATSHRAADAPHWAAQASDVRRIVPETQLRAPAEPDGATETTAETAPRTAAASPAEAPAEALRGAPAEPAETARLADLLARLAPSMDRFLAEPDDTGFKPYIPGTIPSEAAALPDEGVGADAATDDLVRAVEHGSRMSAPGWLGFITTGPSTIPAVAAAAVAATGGQRYTLHAFNALERTGLRWLAELCGLPEGVTGVFSSGGSTANLIALGAARQAAFERLGHDPSEDGLPPGVRGRIYTSTAAHRTVHRAAGVLGLGRGNVVEVPIDREGGIEIRELEAALERDARDGIVPVAVVAIAGVTDTGSVDRIDRVAAVARRFGAWLHVDGAYGLVANASPRLRHRFAGIEEADSWIVDPHKWLATTLGIGATFVRDEELLTRAFAEGHAAYLEGSFSPDTVQATSQFDSMAGRWADQTTELSSPPRGVIVWALLREIGRQGVIDRVDRHVAFARAVADDAVAHPRLELLLEPQLSIACFRYVPAAGAASDADLDELNGRILERLRAETPLAPSSTRIGGRFAIRPCFINPRTTEHEVRELTEAVVRIGDRLADVPAVTA